MSKKSNIQKKNNQNINNQNVNNQNVNSQNVNNQNINNQNVNNQNVNKQIVNKQNINNQKVNKQNSNKQKVNKQQNSDDVQNIKKNPINDKKSNNISNSKNSNIIKEKNGEGKAKVVIDDIEDKVIIEKGDNSILSDIKENIFLWSLLAVLSCILIVALIITNIEQDSSSGIEENTTTTQENTTLQEQMTTETGEVLPEADGSPFLELVSNYLKASRIDVSMEEIGKYVDSTENITLANNEILKKYIQEYQNLECYVLDSSKEDTYVVVAIYGCKFHNIETAAPGCETFIVTIKDGKHLIHNLTVQETIDTYISSNFDRKTINDIMSEVNTSLERVLETDEELKKVISVIMGEQ